jgi:hypothetical protein
MVNPGALLFVEPNILNGFANGTSQFLLPIGLPDVVYEPHQYGAVSLNLDGTAGVGALDLAGPAQFYPDLALDFAVADRMGAAIWLGEWGAIDPAQSVQPTDFVDDDLTAQDSFMLGSDYWSYDSSLSGSNTAIGAQLRRITPFAIAGTPVALSTGTSVMTLTWRPDGNQTLIAYPSSCTPRAQVSGGSASTRVSGGYLEVDAPGGTTLTLRVACG